MAWKRPGVIWMIVAVTSVKKPLRAGALWRKNCEADISGSERTTCVARNSDEHPYDLGEECPRQELNLCTRFRKPLLYPLSYGGS